MNRRRASEDFYFLQALMRGGRLTELGSTRVLPSPRVSQRVPFGTGRAIEAELNTHGCAYLTYSADLDPLAADRKFESTSLDTVPATVKLFGQVSRGVVLT